MTDPTPTVNDPTQPAAPLVPVTAAVDGGDVVAVFVSQLEARLDAAVADALDRAKAARERKDRLRKEVDAGARADLQAIADTRSAAVVAAVKDNLGLTLVPRAHLEAVDFEAGRRKVRLALTQDGAAQHHLSVTLDIALPGGLAAAASSALEAERAESEAAAQAADARSQLGRIPTYERQARAALAEHALSRSAEGQALLERMNRALAHQIDRSPALRRALAAPEAGA